MTKRPRTMNGALLWLLIMVLVVNQFVIASVAVAAGRPSALRLLMTIGAPPAHAEMMMWMPILNEDGKTTTLKDMPTITEVPAFAHSGNDVADAEAVMVATGTPFYAPAGISFDDPVGSLTAWGSYASMQLSDALNTRYKHIIGLFTCNFCCGGPMDVTRNGNCGCQHANAARGFFKYMLSKYGDQYTDDQLFGEAYRWQAIWYPEGVVEDYMLANGMGGELPHKPHGGVGADGMHGLGSASAN